MINPVQLSEQSINTELETIQVKLDSYMMQWSEGVIDNELYRELSIELVHRRDELRSLKNKLDTTENQDIMPPSQHDENTTSNTQNGVSKHEKVVNKPDNNSKPEANSNGADSQNASNFTVLKNESLNDPKQANDPQPKSLDDRPIVVDIRDITKTYYMGEFDLQVLKGVTLQVRQGEFISIMGPSGSGKSTLMNILGALDQSSTGEYYLDGTDVSEITDRELAQIRNKKIGFVFQSFNLLKRTSALRQVELPLIYGTATDRTQMAKQALESVGLGQRMDHTPAELSGGQQQRVAIARAIVNEPSLILADEPTGNLDSRSGMDVMQIFQSMNREQNITTIFVTHDPWIARHTDRVIMLRDGKIIADHRVKTPLVAGEAERPSEAEELQEIFENTYNGGDEEEYN